jgi:hypothetical protein
MRAESRNAEGVVSACQRTQIRAATQPAQGVATRAETSNAEGVVRACQRT